MSTIKGKSPSISGEAFFSGTWEIWKKGKKGFKTLDLQRHS
jgi:hypothetical protein